MHAMWICPVYKNKIGGGKWRKEKKEKKMREKEREEDMTVSSYEFQHSNGRSSSSQELKLATLQEVGTFSYYG